MKKLLLFILPLLLIFAFSGCDKDGSKVSFDDITYEFTSNVSGKYAGFYTESGGAPTALEFTGKSWTKTIPGGKAPQIYLIQVSMFTQTGFNSTLKIYKGGKVVKTQDFTGMLNTLQYNTQ